MAIIKTYGNLFANKIDRHTDTGNQQYIYGYAGNDTLIGSDQNDTLDGGTGADVMKGGWGDDVYLVDSVNDSVLENAGEGTDTIETTVALDLTTYASRFTNVENLRVSASVSSLKSMALGGNALDNVITGHAGADTIKGYGGNDSLLGLAGNDNLDGGDGNDTLDGGTGSDLLNGGAGNDSLLGGPGNDTLNGGDGNDTLEGGGGNDVLAGGAGDDVYRITGSGVKVNEAAGGGIDTVVIDGSVDLSTMGEVENVFVDGVASGVSVTVKGNALNNNINLNAQGTVDGGAGNDTINGGMGDTLLGGAGNDLLVSNGATLEGGEGNDTLQGVFSFNADHFVFAGNFGQDEIQDYDTPQGFNLANPVDVAEFKGIDYHQLWLTHNAAGDLVISQLGTGNRVAVRGWQGGYDAQWGRQFGRIESLLAQDGTGSAATVNLNTDQMEALAQIMDKLATPSASIGSLSAADQAAINALWHGGQPTQGSTINGGAGNDNLVGYSTADLINGGAGDDTLSSGGGADTLVGGLGNDTYRLIDGQATVVEQADGGIDTIASSANFDLRTMPNVENLTLLDQATRGWGNDGNNTITASYMPCIIDAGAGNDLISNPSGGPDTLIGGAGDDLYSTGNWGNETYHFDPGFGHDTIQDFGGSETAEFAGIRYDQLWFSESNGALTAQVLGTTDQVYIPRWAHGYKNMDSNIETWKADNGAGQQISITSTQVDQLAAIMSSIAQPTSFSQLSAVDQARIAAVWGVTLPVPQGVIQGTAGNDTLVAQHSGDTVVGGAGNDLLQSLPGVVATYRFEGTIGNDTVAPGDATSPVVLQFANTSVYGQRAADGTQVVGYNGVNSNGTGSYAYFTDPANTVTVGSSSDPAAASRAVLVTVTQAGVQHTLSLDDLSLADVPAYIVPSFFNGQTTVPGDASGYYSWQAQAWSQFDLGDPYAASINTPRNLQAGNTATRLVGGVGNDTLTGGANNDTLLGSLGDDVLIGGGGNDLLIGGNVTGNDTYVFAGNFGQDQIIDLDGFKSVNDTAPRHSTDTIRFDDVDYHQLWFTGTGAGVQIQVLGTANSVRYDTTMMNTFDGAIESIVAQDNGHQVALSYTAVAGLVQAMAGITPPTSLGQLSSSQQQAIGAAQQAAWQALPA